MYDNQLVMTVGKNGRGQWLVRDPKTGSLALFDNPRIVTKPAQVDPALRERMRWVISLVIAADELTNRDQCAPFKA